MDATQVFLAVMIVMTGAIVLYQAVLTWNSDRHRSYTKIIIVVLAALMIFLIHYNSV